MPHKDPVARAAYKLEFSRTPEQRENQRKYRLANPDINKGNNPPKRRSMLRKRYGITDDDYFRMLKSQNGGCAICGSITPNNGHGDRFFDVDHCHKTGRVRGLLCRDCNVTVGVVEKKWQKIEMILEYLEFDPKEPERSEET